ncbi:CHASE2 domain-containing protein [Maridesulfovibrio salexigens]|uniref:Adenylate/guanylate cyclase with Chase sensor n=1 Tax=Maridesulfovibrio salexigens (strain ATCC 14822 / DSM 2638 / NCIMB 8403 / VKM B-1763) TaxID=526222 RepID=C6C040_MARSD|nr:adenylate/guanylate cyclase domain-containing protein [Maridesulfovibrio salexigens]ACS80911.1 adenylate/guanylate cyclase with Chase sensor [Maridesulfovibrio salexigens DSM 2638]
MLSVLKKIAGSDSFFLLLTGLAVSFLVAALYIFQPPILQFVDYKIYDQFMRSSPVGTKTNIPVIVDIDDESLAELGQWPWPRYRMALLLAKIQQAGALSTGLDILIGEPDRTSPATIQKSLREELGVTVHFKDLPQGLMDNDLVLADVLERGRFVLGFYFDFIEEQAPSLNDQPCFVKALPIAQIRAKGAPPLKDLTLSALDAICPLPVLAKASPLCGFYNSITDYDGVVRRVPLIITMNGKQYPSLALATLMKAMGRKNIIAKTSPIGIESIRVGKTTIPVDAKGQMLVRYRGGMEEFPYYRAKDILSGKVGEKELKGKIVFMGTSAAGLRDLRVTPFASDYPGVEVHATIVDNILTRDFLLKPDWVPGLELVLVMAAGIISMILLTWSRSMWMILPIAGMGAGIVYGSLHVFQEYNAYLTPMYALIALGTNFTLLTLIKFWREEGQKKFLQATFSSYLAPELIDEMFSNREMPELGGEAREITAYFTDIQSFSTFSEKLTAPQLVELLNEYLSVMTDILIEEKGTLDKYEGDAIIAFFGAPMDVPDHALRACRVAVKMQKAGIELREKWAKERQLPDEPDRNTKNFPEEQWAKGEKWPKVVHNMRTRIGVNSGEIVVGNMGSSMRMNYTMMGDAVNLAARLEEGAKQFGIFTAVSHFTLDQEVKVDGETHKILDLVEARLIDNIQVVGKNEPVRIYELVAMKGGLTESEEILFDLFAKAREEYVAQNWDKAIELYKEANKYELYDDTKFTPSDVFIKRAEEHKINPPVPEGELWDGVYRMTKK